MKKGIVIAIGVGGLVLAAALVIIIMANQNASAPSPAGSSGTPGNNSQDAGSDNQNSDVKQVTTNKVSIKDSDYSPTKVVVKKGTTVTWTNEDTMGHNVVASDSSRTGGLPSVSPLLKKGETFSHTFDEVGVFPYTCTPHPFMRGAVEVIE